jgi:hypothetical protein
VPSGVGDAAARATVVRALALTGFEPSAALGADYERGRLQLGLTIDAGRVTLRAESD